MRVVLDTDVVVSGVLFQGPPYRILDAWRHRRLHLVVSPAILEEYQRVSQELAAQFPLVDLGEALELLARYSRYAMAGVAGPWRSARHTPPDRDRLMAGTRSATTSTRKSVSPTEPVRMRKRSWPGSMQEYLAGWMSGVPLLVKESASRWLMHPRSRPAYQVPRYSHRGRDAAATNARASRLWAAPRWV